jgi:outer membrane lipoprotein-sorting protein
MFNDLTKILLILFATATSTWCFQRPDVATIVQRSVEANQADWKVAPEYEYFERDQKKGGSKTYHVRMIEGSPYQELVAVNGEPLSLQDQQQEKQKLEEVISQRRSESASDHAKRVAKYEQERKRDHLMLEQLARAFDFSFLREERLQQHAVYVLRATPRAGYKPLNTETEVLTGMQGTMWIDEDTYQWVKVEAEVVHTVSIAGFLARVQPGTRFMLEYAPVADGIWLPTHFHMQSDTKILFLFHHRTEADETYFNYQKAAADH